MINYLLEAHIEQQVSRKQLPCIHKNVTFFIFSTFRTKKLSSF
jgi:hypothetical protein